MLRGLYVPIKWSDTGDAMHTDMFQYQQCNVLGDGGTTGYPVPTHTGAMNFNTGISTGKYWFHPNNIPQFCENNHDESGNPVNYNPNTMVNNDCINKNGQTPYCINKICNSGAPSSAATPGRPYGNKFFGCKDAGNSNSQDCPDGAGGMGGPCNDHNICSNQFPEDHTLDGYT
jgi:hypothetical protein